MYLYCTSEDLITIATPYRVVQIIYQYCTSEDLITIATPY